MIFYEVLVHYYVKNIYIKKKVIGSCKCNPFNNRVFRFLFFNYVTNYILKRFVSAKIGLTFD